MSEIRDVVVQLAVKQTESKIKVDVSEAQKGIQDYESTADEAIKSVADEFEKLKDKAGEVVERVTDLEKTTEALNKTRDAAFQAGEGFKSAATGAMTLVRGAALLGFSADDDLAKFLEKMAKIQGLVDVLSGTFDTLKGVTEGIKAIRTATTAMAAAQVTATASSFSLAGGLAAVEAAALPLLGIGGALALFGVAYSVLADNSGDANDELSNTIRLLDDLASRRMSAEAQLRKILPDAAAQESLETALAQSRERVLQAETAGPRAPEGATPFQAFLAVLRDMVLIHPEDETGDPVIRSSEIRADTTLFERQTEASEKEIDVRTAHNILLEEHSQSLKKQIDSAGDDIQRVAELEATLAEVVGSMTRNLKLWNQELQNQESRSRTNAMKSF